VKKNEKMARIMERLRHERQRALGDFQARPESKRHQPVKEWRAEVAQHREAQRAIYEEDPS
jgi:hypothetical protein